MAPSDLQLLTIERMCGERGLAFPDAVASSQEASEIITAIMARTYEPGDYCYPFGWQEDVPF